MDNLLTLVESRTKQSDLNIDVLPHLVVVFLQFKICMRFPRHMYTDMVLLSTVAFVAIQKRAQSLSANEKMAINQNLPYFNDKPVMYKCHVFIKWHARLIGVFVRLGLLRRILCLLQVKETYIHC